MLISINIKYNKNKTNLFLMVQDPMRKNENSFQDINDNLIKSLKELPELAQ